ncbi:MAG: 50S ribosomal protein L31 [Proteobacteria bacterium]|nr:50S ribosomal protein L31 [Pseudomonadota bacterium]
MKEGIHPKSEEVSITCTCGAVVKTTSTLGKDFTVELCSKCHPFFTGKQRLVDSTGRVERFQKRMEKFQAHQDAKKSKAAGNQ